MAVAAPIRECSCGVPLEGNGRNGRPRTYCSDRCRKREEMRRRRSKPMIPGLVRYCKPRPDSVPMSALKPLVEEWLTRNPLIVFGKGWYDSHSEREDGNVAELAAQAGVPTRLISNVRRGFNISKRDGAEFHQTFVSFETADKLLCAMEMVHEWHFRLAPWYGANKRAPAASLPSASAGAPQPERTP